MNKEIMNGIFESLLYLKSVAEEENEPELAEEIQKLSELVFVKMLRRLNNAKISGGW
jgi:hypothetical protein